MKQTMNRAMASILIYFLTFAVSICWATMSIEVNPDQINATSVPLGRKVTVSALAGKPQKVEILNKNNAAYYYEINILRTAQTTYPLREGFVDIPDTNWISPEEKEVRIEANQAKEVELHINIPNKLAYADKKYQAVIEVKSKKNNLQEVFVLACQISITLQTEKQTGWQWPFRRWLEWIKKNIRR